MFWFRKGWVTLKPHMTWGCIKTHCASTVTLYMSTLPNPDSLTLPLTTDSLPNMTFNSLVDSRSSNSFIDQHSSKPDTSQLMAYYYQLRLIDGTSNSIISQALDLQLCFPTGESQKLSLFVTLLDQSCMIVLGYCWLTHYNPSIVWELGSISFRQSAQHKSLSSPPIEMFPSAAPPSKPPDPVSEIMKPTSPVEPEKHWELPSSTPPHILVLASSRAPNVFNFRSHTLRSPVNYDHYVKKGWHEQRPWRVPQLRRCVQQIQSWQISWTPTIWSQDHLDEGTALPFGPNYSLSRRNLRLCISSSTRTWPLGYLSLTLTHGPQFSLSIKRMVHYSFASILEDSIGFPKKTNIRFHSSLTS